MINKVQITQKVIKARITSGARKTVISIKSQNRVKGFFVGTQGPKGADGADGADGRSLGWLFYKDSEFTANSKRQIAANVRTQITNNGQSTMVSTTYKPANAVWWNAAQNKFVGDAPGDAFIVGVNLRLKANITNRRALITFDIGTANPPHTERIKLDEPAETEYVHSFVMLILGSPGFIANGGTLNISCDGDLQIWDTAFKIAKINQFQQI